MLTSTPFPKSFASDNHSGVHPAVLAAILEANTGDAPAYGGDAWTEAMEDVFRAEFGAQATTYAMFNGTGANVVGLSLLLRPYDAVLCPATAHINTNECGAAERLLGTKLIPLPTENGKITVDDIRGQLSVMGNVQHSQPRVVSISQVTECGTCYTADEIAELAEFAHAHGLLLHMDGARLANAAAELGCSTALPHHRRGRGPAQLRRHQERRDGRRGRGPPSDLDVRDAASSASRACSSPPRCASSPPS